MPAAKKKKAPAKKVSVASLQRKVQALQKSNRQLRKQVQLLSNDEGEFDLNLTPEQEADLIQRCEETIRNPGRGRLIEDAAADILKKIS